MGRRWSFRSAWSKVSHKDDADNAAPAAGGSQPELVGRDEKFDGNFGAKDWYRYPDLGKAFYDPADSGWTRMKHYTSIYTNFFALGAGFVSLIFCSYLFFQFWYAIYDCKNVFDVARSTNLGFTYCNNVVGEHKDPFNSPTGRAVNNVLAMVLQVLLQGLLNLVVFQFIYMCMIFGWRRLSTYYKVINAIWGSTFVAGALMMFWVGKLVGNDIWWFGMQVAWSVSMCFFTGQEVARILGSKGSFARITLMCFAQLCLLMIYFTWLSLLLHRNTSAGTLIVIRTILHPMNVAPILAVSQRISMEMGLHPGGAQVVWVSFFLLIEAYWGRFLTLQLSSVGNIVIINMLQTMFMLTFSISFRPGASIINNQIWGKQSTAAIVGTKGYSLMQFQTNQLLGWMDVGFTSLFWFMKWYGPLSVEQAGFPMDIVGELMETVSQIVTIIPAKFIGSLLEVYFFDYDIKWIWAHLKPGFTRFMLAFAVMMCLCSNWFCTIILYLFMPTNYPDERGLLLDAQEQIDITSVIYAQSLDQYQ